MIIPNSEALTGAIAKRAGVSVELVRDVLVGHGVSLLPVQPAQRALDIRRLSFAGNKVNTQWDGPFKKTFEFGNGVTALITDENLRGKSSVLELITWALRGSPRRLRADVKPWFERIELEYSVNGIPMAVVLTRQDSGFVADILRADDSDALHSYLACGAPVDSVHFLASGLSEEEFDAQQDRLMLTLLSLEPMTNFQKYKGSDQGRPLVNTWPAYFGGLYLPSAGSEILLGDTVFASLPARILQMFCNVPLMSTYIRLTTLTKQVKQDESNRVRRTAEDSAARTEERTQLMEELARIEKELTALPSASGRSYEAVAAQLREAELALVEAMSQNRAARTTFDDAKALRQAEERRTNSYRETELATLLFQGLMPKHCPRCEQAIGAQRSDLELSDHQCAVCTKEIPISSNEESGYEGASEEEVGDGLEALRQAEEAAQRAAEAAREQVQLAQARVDELVADLNGASRSGEFTVLMALQLEEARLRGRLESLPNTDAEPAPSESLLVLEAAVKELAEVTRTAAFETFEALNKEIVALGRKFGIDNLEKVELNRQGGMKVTTAGVESPFREVTGGERLRLRVAVVVALLRVGHRAGYGSHPGLILLDSPGSDELTIEDEATLLRELDSLKAELPRLQVVVASAEPTAVQGSIPEEGIYSSLDGSPLW